MQNSWRWETERLAVLLVLVLACCGVCIGQESQPADKGQAPDILDATDSSSTGSSIGNSSGSSNARTGMSCSNNMPTAANLPVATVWSPNALLTFSNGPLQSGSCVGFEVSAEALADTPCVTAVADSYILVEFWQLDGSTSSGSPSVPSDSAAADVRVYAAKGTQPWVNVNKDGIRVTPPVRISNTGMTPVGSFTDDAAIVYRRPVSRLFLPTNSPATDAGEPLDAGSWYITIANIPSGKNLPHFAVKASCIIPADGSGQLTSNSSAKQAAAAVAATDGIPCPVPAPRGEQCGGHGTCTLDVLARAIEDRVRCDCSPGFGSWACQLPLPSLPLNPLKPTLVTVAPDQWGHWEVTLPGPMVGSAAVATAMTGNEELLVTAVRALQPGFGGNPLLFLKPYITKNHNEPALDGLDSDIVSYSDLRSFQLQLNKHYLLVRLPLRDSDDSSSTSSTSSSTSSNRRQSDGDSRRAGSAVSSVMAPRRWYVSIYNSNASRLSEPVKIELLIQYRDLSRQSIVCPFDCSGEGRCVDPQSPSQGLLPLIPKPPDASVTTAIGPMQEQTPSDAGFMCICNPGFGGLLCEGRVQNLTVGVGEQAAGPELLDPGQWFFYQLMLDSKFNPQINDLGIQWNVGLPGSQPSNYTNAFTSFDQGPIPRQLVGDGRLPMPVHKGMKPYTLLLVGGSNQPLPLQVPGGQLTPGATYVLSIYNSDYVFAQPFMFTLGFFQMSDQHTFLHPYMSILLGVTAAVVLCLAMTLCKRLIIRYGLVPWRWQQRRQQLAEAAARGHGSSGNGANGNSLSLVLAAQHGQRGVPAEIYQAFPCRPYAQKDYQQRQNKVLSYQYAQQQQQSDVIAANDQQLMQQEAGLTPVATAASQGTVATGSQGSDQQQQQQSRLMHILSLPQRLQQQQQVQLTGLTAPQQAAIGQIGSLQASSAVAVDGAQPVRGTQWAPQPNGTTAAVAAPAAVAAEGTADGDEAPSCAVCLCEYVPAELVRELPCGHEFHQVCIDQWMVSHSTCPICRAPLWHGAYDAAGSESHSGTYSDSDNDNRSVAIYVHQDMPDSGNATAAARPAAPAAGFRRHRRGINAATSAAALASRVTGSDDRDVSSDVSNTAAANGGGSAADTASQGITDQSVAAADAPAAATAYGVTPQQQDRQQPQQRLSQGQQQRRQRRQRRQQSQQHNTSNAAAPLEQLQESP